MPLSQPEEAYTYEDYLNFPEDTRAEIVNGEIYLMSSPSLRHQEICGELYRQLANFLEGKKCRVFLAPLAVRLFAQKKDTPREVDTVVEPDISVVCDKNKITSEGLIGAPDMTIEVISPSSRRYDRMTKFQLYQLAGVREYWIVDPLGEWAQVFLRSENGQLTLVEDYGKEDIAKVNILPGCFIDLGKVFAGRE
ncbi:MAG: Uma2 family endonuclease [Selenomonadaceae bacterium]|nr:Uma2 family endonuclease [Selenomonadaceae bacterium]